MVPFTGKAKQEQRQPTEGEGKGGWEEVVARKVVRGACAKCGARQRAEPQKHG